MESVMQHYKQLWIELKNLDKEVRMSMFRRAQIVVSLFESEQFRGDHSKHDDDGELIDLLSPYVDDICCMLDFSEIKELLKFAPNKSQWEAKRLKVLYAEMLDSRRPVRQAKKQKPEQQGSAVELLRKKIADMTTKINELKSTISEKDKEIRTLRNRLNAIQKQASSAA
jgi:hypothetical protein